MILIQSRRILFKMFFIFSKHHRNAPTVQLKYDYSQVPHQCKFQVNEASESKERKIDHAVIRRRKKKLHILSVMLVVSPLGHIYFCSLSFPGVHLAIQQTDRGVSSSSSDLELSSERFTVSISSNCHSLSAQNYKHSWLENDLIYWMFDFQVHVMILDSSLSNSHACPLHYHMIVLLLSESVSFGMSIWFVQLFRNCQ